MADYFLSDLNDSLLKNKIKTHQQQQKPNNKDIENFRHDKFDVIFFEHNIILFSVCKTRDSRRIFIQKYLRHSITSCIPNI